VRCWVCGATADGACRFCGRGICKTHARTKAFLFAAWPTAAGLRGLAIEDAIWCGVCHPRPDPISVDFLDAEPPPNPS
jgi:hypothetical protein